MLAVPTLVQVDAVTNLSILYIDMSATEKIKQNMVCLLSIFFAQLALQKNVKQVSSHYLGPQASPHMLD
jgi:hypothetical protein